jgi:hypothetical protein
MPNNLHMLEPIVLVRERHHAFKSRVPKKDLQKGQHDLCLHCMGGKHNPTLHHAFPESTRHWGSGGNRGAYQTENNYWQVIFEKMLVKSSLPTGLARVYVEARYTIGKRMRIDQDNLRYPCSKFLGDTLSKGGWIPDDSHSDEIDDWQFEFGGLSLCYEKDVWKMELTIFPTLSVD